MKTAKPGATPTCWPGTSSAGTAPRSTRARPRRPTPAFIERFDALIERRARREPVAYIRGEQEFWSRDFAVNPAVLIPRPETELIIEELLECFPADLPHRPCRILDIGTGSGCLAVTAAAEIPLAQVTATDISRPALDVARANAERHGVADRITFAECAYVGHAEGPFDFILANPPYVTESEYQNLAPEVREYEPALALVAGDDGFRDIRQIVDIASRQLVARRHGAHRDRLPACGHASPTSS